MKTSYLSDSQDHITEAGAANGTRLVSPGTILIVVRGMILGQHFPVAIVKLKMAFNQDLKALQCALKEERQSSPNS
jgi:type I restriction enzyme S subunit